MRGEDEAEGLGGLDVDDQLEVHGLLDGLLDGQIGRPAAFQDFVHVVCATADVDMTTRTPLRSRQS
jgi:hypothetical protein